MFSHSEAHNVSSGQEGYKVVTLPCGYLPGPALPPPSVASWSLCRPKSLSSLGRSKLLPKRLYDITTLLSAHVMPRDEDKLSVCSPNPARSPGGSCSPYEPPVFPLLNIWGAEMSANLSPRCCSVPWRCFPLLCPLQPSVWGALSSSDWHRLFWREEASPGLFLKYLLLTSLTIKARIHVLLFVSFPT